MGDREIFGGSGSHVNAVDNQGWTALMHVVDKGELEVIRYLVELGADIDVVRSDGMSLLLIAADKADKDNLEVVKIW